MSNPYITTIEGDSFPTGKLNIAELQSEIAKAFNLDPEKVSLAFNMGGKRTVQRSGYTVSKNGQKTSQLDESETTIEPHATVTSEVPLDATRIKWIFQNHRPERTEEEEDQLKIRNIEKEQFLATLMEVWPEFQKRLTDGGSDRTTSGNPDTGVESGRSDSGLSSGGEVEAPGDTREVG